MFSVPDHFYKILHRGHNSTRRTRQLCRCATFNRNCTYTKLRIINRISRLDSTLSVFVIIRTIHTLSWCQIVVRIKLLPRPYEQDFAVNFYSDLNSYTAFQEDLKYSDFFQDHLPQHIGDIRREFIFMDLKWDLKGRPRFEQHRPAQQS